MVDAAGTNVYSYTAGNQLLTDDGPFAADTVTNTYVNRMRTALALQQTGTLWTNGFIYDAERRLSSVTSPAGTFTYSYGASPLAPTPRVPNKVLLPNAAYITNTYDSAARLTGTYLNNSLNTALDSYSYVYNLANQRTRVTRTDSSTVDFTFDKIGQLTVGNSSVNYSLPEVTIHILSASHSRRRKTSYVL